MKFAKLLSIVTAALILTTLDTSAQAPVQTAPAKVGIIYSEAFSRPTGGSTRLITALQTRKTQLNPKHDESTQLAERFDAPQQLQQRTPDPKLATTQEQAETLQIAIRRKQEH